MNFLEDHKLLRTLLFTLLVIFVGPIVVRSVFGTDKCLDDSYGGPLCGMETLQVLGAIVVVSFLVYLFFGKNKNEQSSVSNESQAINPENNLPFYKRTYDPVAIPKTAAKLVGIFIIGPVIGFFLIAFLIMLLMGLGSFLH